MLLYRGEIGGVKIAFGGASDLITQTMVVDFKSIERGLRGFREPKPSECAQLAGYRLAAADVGLCESTAECWNLYFDRESGRLVRDHKWGWTMLQHGLSLLACAARVRALSDKICASVKRASK